MVTGESGNCLIVCWPVAIHVACITVSRPGGELGNVNAVEHYKGHSSPPNWECARLPLAFDRLLGEFHPPAGVGPAAVQGGGMQFSSVGYPGRLQRRPAHRRT